jgi:hypothetical protein
MSTIVRAPLVFVAALAMLGTSVPLSGQAVAKAGPRGTAATAARASAPAAVRVSRPNAPEPSASVATLARYAPLYDLHLLRFSDRDCEETQIQQRPDPRRLPWGLGWLQRYGRDVEVERGGVAPPSLYLRSPLLSGLYRRPDCPRERTEVEVTCAVVSLVADDDAAMSIEVPLPQLDAASPRQLRDAIRDALEDGETVVLMTTEDEEFDLMPGSVRQVDATACRGD